MDLESIFTPLVAFLILVTSLSVSAWILYVGTFYPTQWLTPVNKVILITGCDSGIGWQLARHFHQKGSIVIATVLSIKSEGALKLQTELQGDRFHLISLDLSDKQDIARAVRNIEDILAQSEHGLHALVNNAGICVFGEFDFCTMNQVEEQIIINFIGTISFTKLLLPKLIQSKGRIVNVSSVNALVPFPGISVYTATKRAIEGFGDALRMELYKFNVQVINVRLGDYAKLTNIMTKHEQVVAEQRKELSRSQQNLYKHYFTQYHQSALANYGYFSPKEFKHSSLFNDFDEAIFTFTARKFIVSATFSYKCLIYFLYFIPLNVREALIRKFANSMIHGDNQR